MRRQGASNLRQSRPRRLSRPAWVALCLLVVAGGVSAAPFHLIEDNADGGGEHSQGTRFAVEGSIGQPDAGRLQGSRFAIQGGFWRGSPVVLTDSIFKDGFEG